MASEQGPRPRIGWLMVLGGLALGAAAPPDSPPPRRQLAEWAAGPVQWLLLPPEHKELRRVGSAADAVNFIERFWSRRDPDPATPGNPFREAFLQRVEAADLLYVEADRRGSLTDRGRALILLGPPAKLRIGSRPSLKWNPRDRRRRKTVVEELPVEVWIYRVRELPRVMAEALAQPQEAEIELTFIGGPQRTYLSEGEDYLELAAQVALARPH